jgi:predicted ATP-binding protein involved in virulence
MRIAQISITGLFGVFDHVIPLNLDDRITIIHAPNGYGKTIVLRMLDSLFNVKPDDLERTELNHIPYEKFEVEFDNGVHVEFDRSLGVNAKFMDSLLKLSRHDNSDKMPLRDMLYAGPESDVFLWQFQHLKDDVSIHLIESQRLFSLITTNPSKSYVKVSEESPPPTVRAYSNELIEKISEYVAEYASVSQSLDRTFPTRILKRDLSNELSTEDLKVRLKILEQHRYRLIEAGLLEDDDYPNLQFQEEIDGSEKNVLSIYAEDMEKKFRVFDGIADKIDLFQRIINSRFSYKEVSISIKNGLVFKSKYPNESSSSLISSELLSSGEQHELILFYELLFKDKENSLVLIDEPEISLHVGWQINFLKDLEEISKLANLDFLIATHSPSIIHGRWDLTVELKGLPR